MGGPIVRTGPSAQFSEQWERIFGGGPARKSKTPTKAAKKAAPKKKAAKKTAKKSTKKKR